MALEITRTLRLGRSAPMAARHAVEGLSAGLAPRASERLRLVVSELVTNAVLNSGLAEGSPIKVAVRVSRTGAEVEIVHAAGGPGSDGGGPGTGVAGGSTSTRDAAGMRLSGDDVEEERATAVTLGLQIVDSLCREWGIERSKEVRVWARVPLHETS